MGSLRYGLILGLRPTNHHGHHTADHSACDANRDPTGLAGPSERPGPDRILLDHGPRGVRHPGDLDRAGQPGQKHLLQHRWRRRQPLGLRMATAGFPITTAPAATSPATKAPQRTTAPSPTDTPLRMVDLPWTQVLRP